VVDWSALNLPAVLLPAAVVEGREGHGVGAAPATVRLTGDVVAELSVTRGAEVLLAAVALQRALVRLAGLQPLDDLAQLEHGFPPSRFCSPRRPRGWGSEMSIL